MSSSKELKRIENISIVNPLVLETLEKLVEKSKPPSTLNFDSDLKKLYFSIKSNSIKTNEKLIDKLIRYGRSIELILDSYLPIIAKKFGDAWVADEISFSDVTIALGKIQFLNSKFEPLYISCLNSAYYKTKTLIIIPKGEDHTYGGIAATRKLRGMGIDAFLIFDFKKNELENLLFERNYDFIGISSANNFMIEKINYLSTKISDIVERKTPIVLGGNLVNSYKQTNGKLNVDFITQNLEEILNQLSLKYKKVN
jgi:hypothetical protein